MKKLAAFFAILMLEALFMWQAVPARADVNDFIINDFHGRYELKNDINGGRLITQETIRLTFSDQNHGILRALPKSNRGINTRIRVLNIQRDSQPEPYTTYSDSNDNLVLKIGDANTTITGAHTYTISYEASRGVVSFFDDKTEWYWDINGTAWQQPFERVSGELILPEGTAAPLAASCYTGTNGSNAQDCTVTPTSTGYTFETNAPLAGYETLTVAVELKKGVFKPYTKTDWAKDNAGQLAGLGVGLAAFLFALSEWRRHGRDHSGRGTIIPEYEPPAGLTPSEVGLIADYQLQGRDISATVIDLAVKGYLTITDNSKKWFGLFQVHDFSFTLKNSDTKKLKPHEQSVLEMIFSGLTTGETVALKSINRQTAAVRAQALRKELIASLTKENGYFEPEGRRWTIIYTVLGFVMFFAAMFLQALGPGWVAGFVLAAVSFFGFAAVMQRRSHAGVEAYEKAKGLELYMKTAEADRLKMLQSVDRPYAEPAKTYELFEKLLPYAVALGVEKSWAKQFDGLFDKSPDWYQGNAAANFSAASFASSMTSGMSGLSQTFSAQSGSSSSGSSGGGSSGGGGGGGGGGGW